MRNLFPYVLLLLGCKGLPQKAATDPGARSTDCRLRVCDPGMNGKAPDLLPLDDGAALDGGAPAPDLGGGAGDLAGEEPAASDLAIAPDLAKPPAPVGISDYSSHAPGAVTLPVGDVVGAPGFVSGTKGVDGGAVRLTGEYRTA